MSEAPEDQGWGPVVKHYLLSGLTLGLYARRTHATTDGLTTIRLLFLSVMQAGILVGVVLLFIVEIGSPGTFALLPLGLGIAGVAAVGWARRRPLNAASPRELARSYNANFFTGFALAEAPLMVSAGLALWRQELWPYLLSLPFFLVGMALVAPGRKNLAADQRELEARGTSISLTEALMSQGSTSR
ncbi:MAG: hypothetical protein M3391_07300 [Actinomycetota bacterium]|nr:hypothetical protein [Actinomycetota bacterium]